MIRQLSFLITLVWINSWSLLSAATYTINPQSDLVGKIHYHKVSAQDTWFRIAYYYDLGHDELRAVNPNIQNLSRHIGQWLVIPTQHILPAQHLRQGIVVNLSEKRLYYFIDKNTVITYPVGVGRDGWKTPSFRGAVIRKDVAPTWYVPQSIRNHYKRTQGKEHPKTLPPGPKNPLGNYVVRLNMPGILIHGTNNDASVGKNISSGCIRMYNRNMSEFYHLLTHNPRVNFIVQDEKLGLHNHDIYYEKNPSYDNSDENNINALIHSMIQDEQILHIDQDRIDYAYHKNLGIPTKIGFIQPKENTNDHTENLLAPKPWTSPSVAHESITDDSVTA